MKTDYITQNNKMESKQNQAIQDEMSNNFKMNLNYLREDKESFYDKFFDVSDFHPNRMSELSNNIENINFEIKPKEKYVVKRDFNSTENLKDNSLVKNSKNRVTIDIARDFDLISNDEIEDNEFDNYKNKFNFKEKNHFTEDYIQIETSYNDKSKNNICDKNIKNNFILIKEDNLPKNPLKHKEAENNKYKNTYLNRITQLGPIVKLETRELGQDSSISVENPNINIDNIKFNDLNNNLQNRLFSNNPFILNDNFSFKYLGDTKNTLNYDENKNTNLDKKLIDSKDEKNSNFPYKKNKIIECDIINIKNKPIDDLLKEPSIDAIKPNNKNLDVKKNDPFIINNNNFINNIFDKPLNKNDEVKSKNIIVETNKIFETENKIIQNLNIQNEKNSNNNANKKINIKKNEINGKKVTLAINDILNINSIEDSPSEIIFSKKNSEKKYNKFERNRNRIRRSTLDFLNKLELCEDFSDKEDENNKQINEIEKIENNQIKLNEKNIDKKEFQINSNSNQMEILCNDTIHHKNIENEVVLINNYSNDNDIKDQNSVLNEAYHMLKNFENNSFEDNNKKNENLKNNNYNPFFYAIKDMKVKENIIVQNKSKSPQSICKKNKNNNNDEYLLTPGKHFLINNNSKIKEKSFAEFMRIIPENLINDVTKQRDLKEEFSNYCNSNNNFNQNNFYNNKNEEKIITYNNDYLKNKNNINKQKREDFRTTINNKIIFEIEENIENPKIESPSNKNIINGDIDFNKREYENQKILLKENIDFDKNNNINLRNQNPNFLNENKTNGLKTDQNNIKVKENLNQNQIENDYINKEESNKEFNVKKNILINNKNNLEENNQNSYMSFTQYAYENITDIDLNELLERDDINIKSFTDKVREKNKKLVEFIKQIFITTYARLRTTEKNLKEKEDHSNNLKQQIELYRKEIEILEKEILSIDFKQKYLLYFNKFFKFFSRNILNTKILEFEFNRLNIIFSNTINITFSFDELNYKIFLNKDIDEEIFESMKLENDKNYKTERYIFEKIKLSKKHKENLAKIKFIIKGIDFTFIPQFRNEIKFNDKIIEDFKINKIFRKMISYILNNIFNNKQNKFYSMNIFKFFENYKIFIKAATNIVYFSKQFYLWDSIFNDVSLEFDDIKEILIMNFSIKSSDYLLTLTFTCDIFDAFRGYDFIHYNIVKNDFAKGFNLETNKIDKFCEHIKVYLKTKAKFPNLFFFEEFIQNIKKKIMELNN